jgi:hypothetical protein
MFCPDGYLTLFEIVGAFDVIASERQRELPPRGFADKSNGKSERSFYIDTGEIEETETKAYSDWLFSLFMIGQWNNLYACSPSGVALRLARDATAAYRVYDGPFPESVEEQKGLSEHLQYGLEYINNQTFQIDPRKSSANYDEFDGDVIGNMLAPLIGWQVCWRTPKQEITNEELHQFCLAVRNPAHTLQEVIVADVPRRRGRPKRGGGLIEVAVQREFFRRLAAGELVPNQTDSTNAAASAWVDLIFGEALPRSTAQRYLAPIYAKLEAQK